MKKTELCHICEDRVAGSKCKICGKPICDDHNFGGKDSEIKISVRVYNDNILSAHKKQQGIVDICSNCTDKLKVTRYNIPNNILEQLIKNFNDYLDKIPKR